MKSKLFITLILSIILFFSFSFAIDGGIYRYGFDPYALDVQNGSSYTFSIVPSNDEFREVILTFYDGSSVDGSFCNGSFVSRLNMTSLDSLVFVSDGSCVTFDDPRGKLQGTFSLVLNEDDDVGGILDGGTGTLSPVVSSLSSIIGEFLPYVIYICLGVLSAVMGFVAIRWLIIWLSGKILGKFR